VDKRGQPLTQHTKITLDCAPLACYGIPMMKVGDLVRFDAPDDKFHGSKGIVVRRVESKTYVQGFHYEIQTFSGYVIIALDFELERLENDFK